MQFTAGTIERCGIFDKLTLAEDASPEKAEAGEHDFVVYYYLLNQDVQGWYVMGRGIPEPKALSFETGKAPGVPRVTAWLDNLESIARAAGAAPR